MLNEVFSNYAEDAKIRKAALIMYTTWGPKTSFWHRLARLSWREPSKQVAAYINTLIHSMGDMKDYEYQNQ